MGKFIDLTGRQFSGWKVLRRSEKTNAKGHRCFWVCECKCGSVVNVNGLNLRRGLTTKCNACKGVDISKAKTVHGMSNHKAYTRWCNMRDRCNREKNHAYEDYGGRGISICDRWEKFENFYADMGDAPKGKTLDRIDNSKGYSPDNCRWATSKEQNSNRRDNVYLSHNGETKTVSEWAVGLGCAPSVISARLKLGWTTREAVETPVGKQKESKDVMLLTYLGVTRPVKEWEKRLGFKDGLLRGRMNDKWSVCRAFETPLKERKEPIILIYMGVVNTIQGWEKELGFRRGVLRERIRDKWSICRAIETPAKTYAL